MKAAKYTIPVLLLVFAFNVPNLLQAQGSPGPIIAASQINLMPAPASVQTQPGRLPITGSFNVAVKNYADDRLRGGIARMLKRLAGRTVLSFPAELASDESTAALVIQCERAGDTAPSLNENESYSLQVTDR